MQGRSSTSGASDGQPFDRGTNQFVLTNRTTAAAALVNTARAAGALARRGWRLARRLPAGDLAERQLLRAETALIAELHRAAHTVTAELRRRRELSGATTPGFAWRTSVILDPATPDAERVTLVRPLNGQVEPLRAGMAELLGRSAIASTDQTRDYLYATILRQLLPDEARMLATLADRAPRPVVHVATRAALAGTQRLALENASTLGRDAGLTVAGHVPFHLTRLHRFGLVDIGPETPDLADQYAILIADDLVRTAVRAVKHAKVIRRSVAISELGHRFWTACDPLSTKEQPAARD